MHVSGIPFGTTQRYFIGASVGTAGEEVFACAPRYNSEDYWQLGDVSGACFKMSSGQRGFDIKYELPSGRTNLGMMGHSVIGDGHGGLVIGTPMARTFSEYPQASASIQGPFFSRSLYTVH